MNAKHLDRIWIAGGIAVAVLIAALSWLFYINPQLSKQSSLEQQTTDTQVQNAVLAEKVNLLRRQSAHMGDLQKQLRELKEALPGGDALAEFSVQVGDQAKADQVTITSLTAGPPVQVAQNGKAGTAAPSQPAASGNNPASVAGQLFSIPVTLVTEGAMPRQEAFLKAVQATGPRRALVISTQAGPLAPTVAKDGKVTVTDSWKVTTQINVFVAPVTPKEAADFAKQLSGTN